MNKLVTIIMPCFGKAQYILESIDCVMVQTYSNIELVISNDGDTSLELINILNQIKLNQYKYPVKVILTHINKGPAHSRNLCINNASGEYIVTLDADDLIRPSTVEKFVNKFEQNLDSVCLIYCLVTKFGAKDGVHFTPKFNLGVHLYKTIPTTTYMYKKSDWERVGGYSENMVYGIEDKDFLVKLVALNKRFIEIPEFLLHYRIVENSRHSQYTKDYSKVFLQELQILNNNTAIYERYALEYYQALQRRLNPFKQLVDKAKTFFRIYYYYLLWLINK